MREHESRKADSRKGKPMPSPRALLYLHDPELRKGREKGGIMSIEAVEIPQRPEEHSHSSR